MYVCIYILGSSSTSIYHHIWWNPILPWNHYAIIYFCIHVLSLPFLSWITSFCVRLMLYPSSIGSWYCVSYAQRYIMPLTNLSDSLHPHTRRWGVLLYHCVKPTYLPGQSLNIGGGGDLEEGVDNTWSWSGETWYQNLPWQYIALYLFSSRYMWRYTWCTSTLGLKQGG